MKDRNDYKELKELDDALSLIPGLRNQGCSYDNYIGNDNGNSVLCFIYPRNQKLLFIIGRCLDRRYGGIKFTCELDISDQYEYMVGYKLQSTVCGEEALKECIEFAKDIKYAINHNSAMEAFDMNELFEEMKKLDKLENREKQLDNLEI